MRVYGLCLDIQDPAALAAAQEARVQAAKEEIAEICESLVEYPEKNVRTTGCVRMAAVCVCGGGMSWKTLELLCQAR